MCGWIDDAVEESMVKRVVGGVVLASTTGLPEVIVYVNAD